MVTGLQLPKSARGWTGELHGFCNTPKATLSSFGSLTVAERRWEEHLHTQQLEVADWGSRGLPLDPLPAGLNRIPKVGVETKKKKDSILGQGAQLPGGWGELLCRGGDPYNTGTLSDSKDLDAQPRVVQQK